MSDAALLPYNHSYLYIFPRDTRHETRDTRHETRDTRHETRDTRHETRTPNKAWPRAAARTWQTNGDAADRPRAATRRRSRPTSPRCLRRRHLLSCCETRHRQHPSKASAPSPGTRHTGKKVEAGCQTKNLPGLVGPPRAGTRRGHPCLARGSPMRPQRFQMSTHTSPYVVMTATMAVKTKVTILSLCAFASQPPRLSRCGSGQCSLTTPMAALGSRGLAPVPCGALRNRRSERQLRTSTTTAMVRCALRT